jgi:hypothetical protein
MPGPLVAAGVGAAIRGIGKAVLKNTIKRVKKTPNKKFKNVTVKKKKIKDDRRPGRTKTVDDKTPVKGKQGKKNLINSLRRYDRAQEKMQIGRYQGLRKFTDNKGNIVKQKTRK